MHLRPVRVDTRIKSGHDEWGDGTSLTLAIAGLDPAINSAVPLIPAVHQPNLNRIDHCTRLSETRAQHRAFDWARRTSETDMTKSKTSDTGRPGSAQALLCPSDKDEAMAPVEPLLGDQSRDALETMLAAQMLACHEAAMECYGRATGKEQPLAARMAHLNLGARLGRTFTDLAQALHKHRGRADQKVMVEHIHRDEREGEAALLEEQPHAKGK